MDVDEGVEISSGTSRADLQQTAEQVTQVDLLNSTMLCRTHSDITSISLGTHQNDEVPNVC